MVGLVVTVATVRIVVRCAAVAELRGRRLVALGLRVCWRLSSTVALLRLRVVAALDWLVRMMSLEGETASDGTVEGTDMSFF